MTVVDKLESLDEVYIHFEAEKKDLSDKIESAHNQLVDANLKVDNLTLENEGLSEKLKKLEAQLNLALSDPKLEINQEGNEKALLEQIRQLRGMVSAQREEDDSAREEFIAKEKKLNGLQSELTKEKMKVMKLDKELSELKELNKDIMNRKQEVLVLPGVKPDIAGKIGEIKRLRESIRQSTSGMQRPAMNDPAFRMSTRQSTFNSNLCLKSSGKYLWEVHGHRRVCKQVWAQERLSQFCHS